MQIKTPRCPGIQGDANPHTTSAYSKTSPLHAPTYT